MASDKSSLSILRFFKEHVGNKIFMSLALSIVIAVFDTVGIALFLPLFQLISNPDSPQNIFEKIPFINQFISDFEFKKGIYFIQIGILLVFLLKGMLKYFESIYRNKIQEDFIRKIRFTCLDWNMKVF
jgi:subfamily B ATP-binding cassette protein MsbA